MPLKSLCLMLCVAGTAPASGTAEFEQGGVRIIVAIKGNLYLYEVMNFNAQPISRFEIGRHHTYNERVPEHWNLDCSSDRFIAWTEDGIHAIGPLESKKFEMRTTSAGAVLGTSPAIVRPGKGAPIVMKEVWAPQSEPRQTVLLVPAMVTVITVMHAFFLARREQKRLEAIHST